MQLTEFLLRFDVSLGSYKPNNIIHYNCKHFIAKTEKPQGNLRSAVVLFCGLNLGAVLEFHFYVVPAVHRHAVHQSAP